MVAGLAPRLRTLHAPRDFRVWPEDTGDRPEEATDARVACLLSCTAVGRVGTVYGSMSCDAIPLNSLI